jgi:hypothetical protein
MTIQATTVTLGEREFEIRTAPFIRSKPWRKRLVGELKPLFDQISGATDMTFEKPDDLLRVWPIVESLLVDGVDMIFELLISYSDTLQAEREYIENNATEAQIWQAFQEVLRLSDFLGVSSMFGRRIGLSMSGISSKSPVRNTATE